MSVKDLNLEDKDTWLRSGAEWAAECDALKENVKSNRSTTVSTTVDNNPNRLFSDDVNNEIVTRFTTVIMEPEKEDAEPEKENVGIPSVLTDADIADYFAKTRGCNYKFSVVDGKWMVWNGAIWSVDQLNSIDDEILKTVDQIHDEIENTDSIKSLEKGTMMRNLRKYKNTPSRNNVKKAVEMIPEMKTAIGEFNRNRNLLATKNRTLDLKEFQAYEPRREDFITRQLGTEYDPHADCPIWKKFLAEIFNDDRALIEYVQRIVGYTLTAETSEQCFFVLFGNGQNGKSVLIKILLILLNSYGGTSSFKTFDANKRSEQTNDLAALFGKRFVAMSESGKNNKLNESLIKQVTGEDQISCRFLHQEYFQYTAEFKLFLATNHKPVIPDSGKSIWRRIFLIPFTQSFEGERCDKYLKEKLIGELPGILNWALEGLWRWRKIGLTEVPKAITEQIEAYKLENDSVASWLKDNTNAIPQESVPSGLAYDNYKQWCCENGLESLNNKLFKSQLENGGFKLVKKSSGNFWAGFKLE